MISIAIVDSGPLIAVANRADPHHHSCLEALQRPGFHLIIPVFCVAEAAYIIGRRQGARMESRFLRGLEEFNVQAPEIEDWQRMTELVEQYADFPLGAADASVIALAERLETDLIITPDHRKFRAVRPSHRTQFHLLPEDA